MHRRHNPDTVVEAFGKGYSQALEVDPNKRWLFTAGQVGAAPDGSTPESFEDQAAQTWANVFALLKEGGMGVDDIVKINGFVAMLQDFVSKVPFNGCIA